MSKKPITHQDKDRIPREFLMGILWDIRKDYKCVSDGSKLQKSLVDRLVDGFIQWDLVILEGCGLKWISKEAKKFLLEKHCVEPGLIVENFNIARTFDKYYPEDMELRNCLSNNKEGFVKQLTREHVVPVSEVKKHLADWSVPMDEIVENDFDVCLVTAAEDARLTESGYRNERPGGWRRCYRECGIEVERLPGVATV